MGNRTGAGAQRDRGQERLARLIDAVDGKADDDAAEASDAAVVDRWGATAMPDWLDTGRGRRTWTMRESPGFDCLDDDADDISEDTEDADRGDGDPDDDDWSAPKRRWIMLPPAAIGLILVGLIGCGIAGYSLLRQNEPVAPLVAFEESVGSPLPSATPPGSTRPGAGSSDSGASEVVVSVVGLVHRPGLVRLAAGARVADALAHAGGARANADTISLNLAQIVHDGDQILVGQSGDGQVRSAVVSSNGVETPTAGPGGAGSSGSAPVNLNTATEAELDALPGVGPVTAQAILAWRQANGSFSSVDQLAEVDGIGEGRLAKLRPLVTVG